MIVGKEIEMPGKVIAIARNVFHRTEVALDITPGKLFLGFGLTGETACPPGNIIQHCGRSFL
jgi:hypothetical protein